MAGIILHIDMDAFFAQIEERENPHFRGKPLVVGADPKEGKGRGVVSTANYEARSYGIRSAMPISQAWRRCPRAIFIPPQMDLYQRVSEHIMAVIAKTSPLVEQVSLDEAYVDLSFLGSYSRAKKVACDLKEEIRKKEHLACTCALAENKMIAKIACEKAKPDGFMIVLPEMAHDFLSGLPVRHIPGVGEKTEKVILKLLGKRNALIRDLARLPRAVLERELGKAGGELFEHSHGRDDRPVKAFAEAKSIGKEHTFEEDTRDPELLVETFRGLLDFLHSTRGGRATGGIEVVARFSGFRTHTKSRSFSPSANRAVLDREAMRLFLRFVVQSQDPFRLIGVRFRLAPPSGV